MHDPLTDREVGLAADLLDDAGGLVAEQHRHRPHPVAVDHRQVRVAQPGGLDTHQQLVVAGRRQVEFGDRSTAWRSAYGRGRPIWSRTAPRIFMPTSLP